MVIPAETLALHPEFERLKEERREVREAYTRLLMHYSDLTGPIRQHLEAEYMLKIGRKEHKLFSCQVEVLRLKREIALYQAALNRGKMIRAAEVKEILVNEFAEYKKLLEQQKRKLQKAEDHFSSKPLGAEKVKELKKCYRDIVRKLHPDLNPELPRGAAVLWDRAVAAYDHCDWDELFLLKDMVDELLDENGGGENTVPDSREQIREEIEKLRGKQKDLELQIENVMSRVPFVYEALLADPEAVQKKRTELDAMIRMHEERIAALRAIRDGRNVNEANEMNEEDGDLYD